MLLMIPGPIEVAPEVVAAFSVAPPSHMAPDVVAAHGRGLEAMRAVWRAGGDSHPFVVPGSGTIAMEMAVANLVEEGDRVVVVNTGYFSDRIGEMAHRRGAEVTHVSAGVGRVPSAEQIEEVVRSAEPRVVFATHVDTSTGTRVEPSAVCDIARRYDALTVFDGVCATAAERFEMADWDADVYLTASQKAIGLPAGLALMVVSARAVARREALRGSVPMAFDWLSWRDVMRGYESAAPRYFSTPATNHIMALDVSLALLTAEGMDHVFARHDRAAAGMRAAWSALGLELLPDPECAANTLSAIRYPEGVGPELVAKIKAHGVVVAGGLHPAVKGEYFRVGHMGYSTTQPDHLLRTVSAVATALAECGRPANEASARVALEAHLG